MTGTRVRIDGSVIHLQLPQLVLIITGESKRTRNESCYFDLLIFSVCLCVVAYVCVLWGMRGRVCVLKLTESERFFF